MSEKTEVFYGVEMGDSQGSLHHEMGTKAARKAIS
jgi:hypothetical protein